MKMFEQSGIVVLNKPCGISSNSAVNKVKKILGAKKCGHLGTLDLEASGVLLVTVNSATKLFDLFLKKDKSYVADFEFGKETDTLDASGEIVREEQCDISEQQLQKACEKFVGKQFQMPPQFSAKKVAGKVAYLEARAGRAVELQPKEIEIFQIAVLKKIDKNIFSVGVTCSSGTYIRSLARDLGKVVGTCAYMKSLVRIRCADFEIENAAPLEDATQESLLKAFVPSEKLFTCPEIQLSNLDAEKLLNGQKISCKKADGQFKLFCDGQFLGLGEVRTGELKLALRLL